MSRISEGEKEVDSNCVPFRSVLREVPCERFEYAINSRWRKFQKHIAFPRNPFRDAQTVTVTHKRLWFLPLQVVRRLLVYALDVRDILESHCGEINNAGPTTLKQSIGGDGRSQHNRLGVLHRSSRIAQGVEDRARWRRWCGWTLSKPSLAALAVDSDEISKCSSCIDANSQTHLASRHLER